MPGVVDIYINAQDSIALRELLKKNTAPPAVLLRAQILLLKAEGKSTQLIADQLHTNRNTVDKWVNRYRRRSKDEPLESILSFDDVTGGRKPISAGARQWIRANVVEGESLRKFADRIHKTASDAGFPELETISYVSVRNILKEQDS